MSNCIERTGLFASRGFRATAAIALLVSAPSAAGAVVRTCGPDAVANTANVLCAPPSGPCTATQVVLGANVQVTNVAQANCEFDLGTRALRIDKPLEVAGQGFIKVRNAGNITITSTGKLKARGDLVQPNGSIVKGGLISLTSSGSISHNGLLDVSGDSSGNIVLSATGDVTLGSGSNVDGNGISSFADFGQKFADGGGLDITSAAGSIAINGRVTLRGTNQGVGGTVDARADRNVTVNQSIDISGGGGDGGEFSAAAGDRIVVTKAIDADSRAGGGSGGLIDLRAGCDALTCNALQGVVPGGNIDVQGAALTLRGSASDGLGGEAAPTMRSRRGGSVSPVRAR